MTIYYFLFTIGPDFLYEACKNQKFDSIELMDVNDANGQRVATYSYEYKGRHIYKAVNGTTTSYCYDGDQVICEYDGQGNLRKKFLYGVGVDEVVRMSHVGQTADISGPTGQPDGAVDIYDLHAMAEVWLTKEGVDPSFDPAADLNYDGKINNTDSDILSANWLTNAQLSEEHFYYHYDGLGSVIALSDSAGRTVEMYEYDVYGSTIIRAPTQEPRDTSLYGNPYMFTGRRFDTETGLYYYRARYYDPYIGRFLQTDPIGYADSMNLYIYVGNSPITFVDPFGLCQEKPWYEKVIPLVDWSASGGLGFIKGLWGGFGGTGFMDPTPKGWQDILGLGAHVEGGWTNIGAGVSGNWQLGILYGAEDVSEAKGLAGIVAVDLDIKGGIAVTVATSPDLKIWSVSFGPGVGLEASGKIGGIKYFPIWKPLRTFFWK